MVLKKRSKLLYAASTASSFSNDLRFTKYRTNVLTHIAIVDNKINLDRSNFTEKKTTDCFFFILSYFFFLLRLLIMMIGVVRRMHKEWTVDQWISRLQGHRRLGIKGSAGGRIREKNKRRNIRYKKTEG